jgi:hypothetical protein
MLIAAPNYNGLVTVSANGYNTQQVALNITSTVTVLPLVFVRSGYTIVVTAVDLTMTPVTNVAAIINNNTMLNIVNG